MNVRVINQLPDGTEVTRIPGVRYTPLPGEKFLRIEKDETPVEVYNQREAEKFLEILKEIDKRAKEKGYAGSKGDYIKLLLKPVALVLGKQNCILCEARTVILNLSSKLGIEKSIDLLEKTLDESKIEEVVNELQKVLNE